MQKLIYPTKVMNITQNYNGKTSHYTESHGKPYAYPIDENCGTTARDYFYAPCDLIVKRVYGIGNAGTNTIWLESKDKVQLANGKSSYVTIRVTHPNDDTLKKFKIGQEYKQKDKMFLEGNDGHATGYHFHIEINTCKFKDLDNNGWIKNNKGAWVTSPNSIKPEEAFYIDKTFTKVKGMAGLKFKNLSDEKVKYYPKYTGNSKSFVDALNEMGIDSSFKHRTQIAKANGIKVYLGTAKQNIKLFTLLKQGKLIKE